MTMVQRLQQRRRVSRPLLALGGMLAMYVGGCTVGDSRRQYTMHLEHVVEPGESGRDDVALAFGLDEYRAVDRRETIAAATSR